MNNRDICSYDLAGLKMLFSQHGEPAYRAKQLFSWLHQKRVKSFDAMSNLPAATRAWLQQEYDIISAELVRRQVSQKDGTEKYLFGFADGNCVETVAMRYEHGLSVCISTQVGCRMGCSFCASTKNGLVRCLTASEMLVQIYETERIFGQPVDSIVLMGIGEPLDNFDNVVRFYDLITDEAGYGLKNRAVTISTCGLVPEIYKLADLKKQLTLALSLHAPTSEKRDGIMPINRKYPLPEVMEACRYFAKTTGRRISFEYTVIHDFNDGEQDARQLAALLRGLQSHVNVIPVNAAGRGNFNATRRNAEDFAAMLQRLGVNATVRRTLGDDISAACGQLRRETQQK
ncbi:MAG: 23S rRNA (adenine(2503)-C(2))-methyltransferase RlmN [Oscillospiraceae bacterium]|nr:23S rRNA (adenine(2503)-C(2))-methyltransferase RlmN [Oscillospiraceae bacterium]